MYKKEEIGNYVHPKCPESKVMSLNILFCLTQSKTQRDSVCCDRKQIKAVDYHICEVGIGE